MHAASKGIAGRQHFYGLAVAATGNDVPGPRPAVLYCADRIRDFSMP